MQDRNDLAELIQSHPHMAELASQHGRMVEVAILRGDRIRAYDAVDRAFRLIKSDDHRIEPTSATTLDAILDPRTATLLSQAGVSTVGQLLAYTEFSLVELRQVRHRTVEIIKRQLAEYGLCLKPLNEN